MRGLLMYNIGANQTSGSLATNLALPGQCTSSTTTIYPSDYSYIGFDKSSATSVDPIFAYTTSCNACLIGYSCPAGTRLLSDATPCPPGYFCPGGTKQACNAGTFVSSFSATRTTAADCSPCSQVFIQMLALDPVFLALLVHMDLIAVWKHAYLVHQEHTQPLQVRLVHPLAQLVLLINIVFLELHLVQIAHLDLLLYLLHSDVHFNH
jgi:hypothetical protein